jgi:hypothetical protein
MNFMKKIILLGVVLLFVKATSVIGQVNFGLKGGANLTTLKDDANSTDARSAWHAGALAHIHMSKHFAIQPELVYSAQGAEYDNDVKLKLGYVNIPVLAQFMFGNGFRLQTGPQLGILASSEVKNGHAETDLEDGIKNMDVAWTFGAGYVGRSGLGVDARYNLGLRDISDNHPDLKNRVLQVGLFYQFRHK